MKTKVVLLCLLTSIFLTGCSKKPDQTPAQSQDQSSTTSTDLPFQPIVVVSAETKEMNDLVKQAAGLFASKNFDALDDLAKKYRESKESFAVGKWKLDCIYNGIKNPSNSSWDSFLATLKEWVKTKPDSITARVALANGLIDYAWSARGHEYADKVNDENWKLFFQRLNEAVNILQDAKPLKENCPGWWVAMLTSRFRLAGRKSTYDTVFNNAIQEWPDYTPFYFQRANFLLPRWYGSEGEPEKDMEHLADKIGGEKGDMVYAQIIWDLNGFVYSTNYFGEYGFSWSRANKGIEAIEKNYPDSISAINEGAHLAMLAGDQQAAQKYFKQTKGQIEVYSWSSTNDYIECAHIAFSPP